MAAALACGPDAVISHRTAAAMHELRQTWQTRIDVTVPSSRRQRAGIRLHPAVLARDEITDREGIPLTTVSRTLVDLGAVLTGDQLLRTMEQAERMHVLDLLALERVIARVPRRQGTPVLRELLASYTSAPPTRSNFERDFLAFIERAGLPRPLVNASVAGYEVDIYWPQYWLAVELDSHGYHSSPRSFETDRIRDAKLLRARVRCPRITYRRFHDEPDAVLDDLLALIEQAA